MFTTSASFIIFFIKAQNGKLQVQRSNYNTIITSNLINKITDN